MASRSHEVECGKIPATLALRPPGSSGPARSGRGGAATPPKIWRVGTETVSKAARSGIFCGLPRTSGPRR